MRLGTIQLDNPIFLAPMAGYTNLPFRLLAKDYGADVTVTEMVSAKGLYYRDKKTAALMATTPEEAPAALQIFGSDPGVLEEVVAKYLADTPFAILDFNAGCPAPKIVKNGDGSALMKNPKLLGEIIRRIKGVSTRPLTVKTRIGWDDTQINIMDIAEVVEAAGADAQIIHGRTREAFYKGRADWKIIGQVKASSGIPIVLNGDIDSGQAACQALEMTGCDGLMVGRAAVGNPFIFKAIKAAVTTGEILPPPTPRERIEAALEHTEYLGTLGWERGPVREMRKHLVAYTHGLRNATALRKEVFTTETREDIVALLQSYWKENYGHDL